MDRNLLYQAVAQGSIDLAAGDSTDGRIAALDLVVLEDDRRYLPALRGRPARPRRDPRRATPSSRDALDRLAGKIDAATMRALNHEVDGKHRDPAEVAREFLRGRAGCSAIAGRPRSRRRSHSVRAARVGTGSRPAPSFGVEEDGQERGREEARTRCGTRKSWWKSITLTGCRRRSTWSAKTSPSQPQRKLPRNGPSPRISRLNRLWALVRTSLGKFSSTKM